MHEQERLGASDNSAHVNSSRGGPVLCQVSFSHESFLAQHSEVILDRPSTGDQTRLLHWNSAEHAVCVSSILLGDDCYSAVWCGVILAWISLIQDHQIFGPALLLAMQYI